LMAKMERTELPSRSMEEQPKNLAKWIASSGAEASLKEVSK
jgi:hypothetical protein